MSILHGTDDSLTRIKVWIKNGLLGGPRSLSWNVTLFCHIVLNLTNLRINIINLMNEFSKSHE